PDEHGHDRHRKHLGEREDADAHVVGRMEVVIQGAVQPRGPDRIEQEDEPANPGPRRMGGEAAGELRDDDDEDQVEEQLEEGHPPVGRPVLVPTGRLPKTPEDGRLRHGIECSALPRSKSYVANPSTARSTRWAGRVRSAPRGAPATILQTRVDFVVPLPLAAPELAEGVLDALRRLG